jgi:hypothetical protein
MDDPEDRLYIHHSTMQFKIDSNMQYKCYIQRPLFPSDVVLIVKSIGERKESQINSQTPSVTAYQPGDTASLNVFFLSILHIHIYKKN